MELNESPVAEEQVPPPIRTAAVFVGFDSAWMGRARGGICSIAFDGECFNDFRAPELVGFDRALSYIESVRRDNTVTIIALDQPTIVPNQTGMRPVEQVVDSLMRWLGVALSLPIATIKCLEMAPRYGGFCNASMRSKDPNWLEPLLLDFN